MEAESGWQIYWIQESNKTKHAGELLSGLTIGGLVALMKLHNISIRKNDSGIKSRGGACMYQCILQPLFY